MEETGRERRAGSGRQHHCSFWGFIRAFLLIHWGSATSAPSRCSRTCRVRP
jgi:hypothetical protein